MKVGEERKMVWYWMIRRGVFGEVWKDVEIPDRKVVDQGMEKQNIGM